MGILVVIAAFFQQYGIYIMVLAIAAIFGAPGLQQRGKWKAAQWVTFAAMVLSGILAFSQLVLGAVLANVVMLIFGAFCCWPMVSSFRRLRTMGFWRRIGRKLRRRKPVPSNRPRMQ